MVLLAENERKLQKVVNECPLCVRENLGIPVGKSKGKVTERARVGN